MTEKPQEKSFLRMILATAASFVSCTATHPLDTIKIRLQKEGEIPDKQKKYRNLFRGLYIVPKEEGFRALYKGLVMALFREATYSTFRLGLYEPYKNLLGEKPGKPSSFIKKFFAGLLSGCTGAIIANPFDLYY